MRVFQPYLDMENFKKSITLEFSEKLINEILFCSGLTISIEIVHIHERKLTIFHKNGWTCQKTQCFFRRFDLFGV